MFKSIQNFYTKSYLGEEKAWKVFVFGYVALLFPYSIVFGILKYDINAMYFLTVIRLIYSIWLIVALWKCSNNTSNMFFNILTKLFAIFVVWDCYISTQILIF
jgi:hypothetical protein